MMQVEPVTLEGPTVRLEPLDFSHASGLLKASQANPELFIYNWAWAGNSDLEAVRSNITRIKSMAGFVPFAIVLRETGEAVGSTSYLDVRPENYGLEIGATWIGKAYQGTLVNPENKYLLLRHAFETLGAIRVQLKTDNRNLQSQAAIAKLGAKREGVLRKQMILPDGHQRDTVMYSITDDEWPSVKAGLEVRLGYVP